MTRTEHLERANHWLEIAERGYSNDAPQLALAANMYARPAVAAAIAQAHATLALSAESDTTEDVVG